MESFDQSLKFLLQRETADFIRFGLGDPTVSVLGSLPSGLPARARDVDGSYRIRRGEAELVVHLEFHRRHASLEELGIDVAEAQIRLFRRERRPVLTQVWDLYGRHEEPVLGERTLVYGASPPAEVSRSGYQRVNLRGMGAEELLGMRLPGLYALVPLTRDGASEAGVQRAREAIGREEGMSAARRADHLAVLRFIAEAEGVPIAVLKACIAKEELMESELYQSILAEGRAEGEAWGRAEGRARAEAQLRVDAILRLLEARLGALEPGVRERLSAVTDLKVLEGWYEAAFAMGDKRAARRLVEAIRRETKE